MAAIAAPRPAIHQRRAEGEAHDLLGIERVLWFLRIARYPDDAVTSTELVTIADRSMYQGKLLGAGSVVVGLPRADASVTASA